MCLNDARELMRLTAFNAAQELALGDNAMTPLLGSHWSMLHVMAGIFQMTKVRPIMPIKFLKEDMNKPFDLYVAAKVLHACFKSLHKEVDKQQECLLQLTKWHNGGSFGLEDLIVCVMKQGFIPAEVLSLGGASEMRVEFSCCSSCLMR